MLHRIAPATLAALAMSAFSWPAHATIDAAHGSLPTRANSCWSTDNGTPLLDSFTLSTDAVDVTNGPAIVGVTVQAHDVGGPGPSHRLADDLELNLTFEPTSGAEQVFLHRTAPQTWAGSFTVPEHSPLTSVNVFSLHLQPAAGPDRWLYGTQVGSDSTVQVVAADPDDSPPQLTDLRVNHDRIDVGHGTQEVRVSAMVTDDVGVANVKALVGDALVALKRRSASDEFTGVVSVSHWVGASSLPIEITSHDVNGLRTRVTSAELENLDLPSAIQVRGSEVDADAPIIGHLVLPSHTITMDRSGGSVTVRLHAQDRASGIDSVRIHGLPRPGQTRLLHLRSGSRHDGTWTRRLHLPICGQSSRLDGLYAVAHDRVGHRRAVRGHDLKLKGPDRLGPGVTMDGGVGAAGLRFSDAVHGISPTSVLVASNAESEALSGTWACFSRPSYRKPTPCRHGVVRSARFQADDTGAEIGFADLEPEGHLEVLDRWGNPVPYGGTAYAETD